MAYIPPVKREEASERVPAQSVEVSSGQASPAVDSSESVFSAMSSGARLTLCRGQIEIEIEESNASKAVSIVRVSDWQCVAPTNRRHSEPLSELDDAK